MWVVVKDPWIVVSREVVDVLQGVLRACSSAKNKKKGSRRWQQRQDGAHEKLRCRKSKERQNNIFVLGVRQADSAGTAGRGRYPLLPLPAGDKTALDTSLD